MKTIIKKYLSTFGIDISLSHGSILSNPDQYPSYYWGLEGVYTEDFLDLCYVEGDPIIGIDVLIKQNDKYILSFDSWCYQRKKEESYSSYLINSINEARRYLCFFSQRNEVLFSFTLLQ